MQALLGTLVALALAQPSANPRAIDPAANRPKIVAPGGAAPKVNTPKAKPKPKPATPKPKPKPEPPEPEPPKPEPVPEPPKPEPEPEPEPPKPEPEPEPEPPEPEPEPEPTPAKPKAAVSSQPTQADTGPKKKCFPERGRCRRLNVAGIATASVGIGMLGTGIGFLKAPLFPGNAGNNEPIFDRSLRPPGVVLVAMGAVTAVAGILIVVAGHAAHKKPPRSRKTARVKLIPGGVRW